MCLGDTNSDINTDNSYHELEDWLEEIMLENEIFRNLNRVLKDDLALLEDALEWSITSNVFIWLLFFVTKDALFVVVTECNLKKLKNW